jgi:thiamine biosynthesis lipoprotein
MGTVVTMEVVGHEAEREARVERATAWFGRIERACSRFDPASELRRLCDRPGRAVEVSPILLETTRFAIALAGETDGAFDPTMGAYDAVHVDAATHTITLERPVSLDLGAIAKGFAVDMAARELASVENFAIDAGGDLYLGGSSAAGTPWSVGIRHPRQDGALLRTIRATDIAVCTSGDYERGPHIIDARTNTPANGVVSVTTIAPLAMVADGFGTAVFALGPARGIELLERHGLEGLVVTTDGEEIHTRGSRHFAVA